MKSSTTQIIKKRRKVEGVPNYFYWGRKMGTIPLLKVGIIPQR